MINEKNCIKELESLPQKQNRIKELETGIKNTSALMCLFENLDNSKQTKSLNNSYNDYASKGKAEIKSLKSDIVDIPKQSIDFLCKLTEKGEFEKANQLINSIENHGSNIKSLSDIKSKITCELAIKHSEQIKRRKIILTIGISFVFLCLLVVLILQKNYFGPESKYKKANQYVKEGNYETAISLFEENGDYKDSKKLLKSAKYLQGEKLLELKKYQEAERIFNELKNYKESETLLLESKYLYALTVFESKDYERTINLLSEIFTYKDSAEILTESKYQKATNDFDNEFDGYHLENTVVVESINILKTLNYKDSNIYCAYYDALSSTDINYVLNTLNTLPKDFKDVSKRLDFLNIANSFIGKRNTKVDNGEWFHDYLRDGMGYYKDMPVYWDRCKKQDKTVERYVTSIELYNNKLNRGEYGIIFTMNSNTTTITYNKMTHGYLNSNKDYIVLNDDTPRSNKETSSGEVHCTCTYKEFCEKNTINPFK